MNRRVRLQYAMQCIFFACILLLSLLCGWTQDLAQPPILTPTINVSEEQIAYVHIENGTIDLMSGDGMSRSVLVRASGAQNLSWSPKGDKIAFDLYPTTRQIYVAEINNGSELTELTDDQFDNFMPVWSPRGDRIAFVSNRGGSNQYYVMDTNGSNVIQVTTDNRKANPHLSWSPDGRWLAFVSDRETPQGYDSRYQVYLADVDALTKNSQTGRFINLTENINFDNCPNVPSDFIGDVAWSPLGNRIALTTLCYGIDILIVDIDITTGKPLQPKAQNPMLGQVDAVFSGQTKWSPDGKYMAFVAMANAERSSRGIFRIDVDQSLMEGKPIVTQLIPSPKAIDPTSYGWPVWRPRL